jgi:hypothetical protein
MIYSIGHSTLSIEDFLDVITCVDTVIDIRSHPTSKWSQFWKSEMEEWLPERGKRYEWEPRLGGWDVRHAPLLGEMAKVEIDLSPYLKGKFPKQRIGKDRQHDSSTRSAGRSKT